MAKSTIQNIFTSLTKAAQKTKAEKVYLANRPKSAEKGLNSFVVVSLPANLTREVKGNDDYLVTTSGLYTVGVKAKSNNTLDLSAQSNLVQEFLDLFPINDEYITAANPTVIMRGGDETGFQITSIMFDVRTKVNSYLK